MCLCCPSRLPSIPPPFLWPVAPLSWSCCCRPSLLSGVVLACLLNPATGAERWRRRLLQSANLADAFLLLESVSAADTQRLISAIETGSAIAAVNATLFSPPSVTLLYSGPTTVSSTGPAVPSSGSSSSGVAVGAVVGGVVGGVAAVCVLASIVFYFLHGRRKGQAAKERGGEIVPSSSASSSRTGPSWSSELGRVTVSSERTMSPEESGDLSLSSNAAVGVAAAPKPNTLARTGGVNSEVELQPTSQPNHSPADPYAQYSEEAERVSVPPTLPPRPAVARPAAASSALAPPVAMLPSAATNATTAVGGLVRGDSSGARWSIRAEAHSEAVDPWG